MLIQSKPITICKQDHDLILQYLRSGRWLQPSDQPYAEKLEAELKRADFVDKASLPKDVVRLNSSVKVLDISSGRMMEIVLVTPENASLKDRKISILSPVGAALIGFRCGDTVTWKVPAGEKTFRIDEVLNDM